MAVTAAVTRAHAAKNRSHPFIHSPPTPFIPHGQVVAVVERRVLRQSPKTEAFLL